MSTQEGAEEMFFEESSLAPESHERVGYVQNVNSVNNPTKRKRFNTGSIDYDSFNTMGPDDKLNLIFAKLLNIEHIQSEVTSMQRTLRHTDERLQRTVGHVDNNTYKLQHLAYKYLDLETKNRRKNIIMYGLAENHNSTVSAVVREFIENALDIDIEEQELYIEFACRLGTPDGINVNNIANNRNDRMGRRPILCTFSHYTEADYIMRKARLLKGTRYAIDRDYPPEIALARKKMWPEVKELRKVPNSNVQLKFPAKIVVNGRVVKDAFPQWDHLMKVPVTAGLNYICVEESIEQHRTQLPPPPPPPPPMASTNNRPSFAQQGAFPKNSVLYNQTSQSQEQVLGTNLHRMGLISENGGLINGATTVDKPPNVGTTEASEISTSVFQTPRPLEKHTLQIRTVKDLPDQMLPSETHDSQLNSQPPSPSILNPDTHVLITKAPQKQQNNTVVRSTSKTIGTPQLQNNPQVNSQVPKRGTKQADTIGTARARSVSLDRNRSRGRPRSVSTKGRKAQCNDPNTPNFTPVDNILNLTGNGSDNPQHNIQHTQSQHDD